MQLHRWGVHSIISHHSLAVSWAAGTAGDRELTWSVVFSGWRSDIVANASNTKDVAVGHPGKIHRLPLAGTRVPVRNTALSRSTHCSWFAPIGDVMILNGFVSYTINVVYFIHVRFRRRWMICCYYIVTVIIIIIVIVRLPVNLI